MPEATSQRFEFLSPEWLRAVAALRAAPHDPEPAPAVAVTVNLVVTDVPFSPAADVLAHVDTSSGSLVIDEGHRDPSDLRVTVAWSTAKALLVEGDQQAAMSAFLEGKIRVEGDVGKLLAFQSGVVDESTHATARAIRALTA